MENAGAGPRDGQFSQGSAGPGLAEGFAVLGLFALWSVFVLITYSNVPPSDLYHVSHNGIRGGLSRMLVFVGYPTALAAIPAMAIAVDRVFALCEARRTRLTVLVLALVAFALCATILLPGVIEETDLDAKQSNALAAAGVGLAAAIMIWAARRLGGGGLAPRGRGDTVRLVVAAILVVVALPWVFAEVGIFIGDIWPLGHVYRSEQIWTSPKGETLPSVHLGHHHGMGGYLLVITALLLSRELPRMRRTWLRTALGVYFSLMIAYGVANMANDAWYEQVVKRGWTDWAIPSVIRPSATWMWGLIILVGAAIFFTALQPRRDHAATHGPSSTP